MIQANKFLEIVPDSSKLSLDLREIQKTVQNYGNMLYFVPQRVEEILKNQEEILGILKDIQTRIQKLEQQSGSSKRTSGGWLPPSFGTEPLLHQQGNARVVSKPLTEEEKMINLIKSVSEKKLI